MTTPLPLTGSGFIDRFTAAVASEVGGGAGETVHKVAERFAGVGSDDLVAERRRTAALLERAAFEWCPRVLEHAGEPSAATGLRSLRGGQARYIAGKLRRSYASPLPPDVDATHCCDETASALDLAGSKGIDATTDDLLAMATSLGKALAALWTSGALNALPEEIDASLKEAFGSPATTITWD